MQQSFSDKLKYNWAVGDMITKLIYINVAVFAVQVSFFLITFLIAKTGIYALVMEKFYLATNLKQLVKQPWSIFTHMFMHSFAPGGFLGGILHILFNMLWLYWFGKIFLSFQSQRQVLPIYLLGGLAGAALMILAYNTLPAFDNTVGLGVGASAAVMAIVFATVVLVPDYSIRLIIFGTVKIKYIGIVVLVLDFLSIAGSNPGGAIAHIGGAGFGALYMYQLRQGRNLGEWLNRFFDWVVTIPGRIGNRGPRVVHRDFTKKKKKKKKAESTKESAAASDKQAKLDAILDKISDKGYDSLNEEEKAFLFQASKED